MSQNHKAGSPNYCVGTGQSSKKHSKSKASTSKVGSLSNFVIKKSTQTQKIQQSPIEHTEEQKAFTNSEDVNTESPYKNLVKTNTEIILNDSTSDAADFRSPTRKPSVLGKPVQKSKLKSNNLHQRSQTKRGRGRPKSSAKSSTTKIISENFKYFGENPEHVHMAIALSKSAYEAKCGSSGQSDQEDISDISEIARNTKPAFLERFGFTSHRKKLPVENRRVTETLKKHRNRFKYITPILNIRTCEERNSLIQSKISLILCQNNPQDKKPYENVLNSAVLQNLTSRDRRIFNLEEIYQKNNFYVKSLEIPQNVYRCGHFLKDWNAIPGRDKSPCRITNNSTEDKSTNKDQNTNLSSTTSCCENEKTRNDTFCPDVTSQTATIPNANSPSVKSCIKDLSETLSLGSTCSLSIPTEIHKSILGSLSSESKDSAFPNSFTSSTKSTIYSFGSSCRSISPDLFGSDDGTDQQFFTNNEGNVTETELMSKTYIENAKKMSLDTGEETQDPLEKFESHPGDYIKGDQEIKNNSFGKSGVESALSNNIIDLTDDDDEEESVLQPLNKSLPPDIEIVINDDCCINLHSKNQSNRSSTPKAHIYNLDEFEDCHDKLEVSFESNEYLKDTPGKGLNNKIDISRDNPKNKMNVGSSKDDHQTMFTANEENHDIIDSADLVGNNKIAENSNNAFNDIEIAKGNDSFSSKIGDKSYFFSKSHNETNVKENHSTCRDNKTDSCVKTYIIIDSPDSHDVSIDLNDDEIQTKRDNSLSDTPKRNHEYRKLSSFYDENFSDKNDTSHSIDNNGKSYCHNTNSKNSTLEETPERCVENKDVRSPCFDDPVFYDSTDLNVTDYVNNMLDQETFDFEKTEHLNDRQEKTTENNVNNVEVMSLSQESQISLILDEELNYSSNFATPARVNIEARNKKRCSYNKEIEKLDGIISISPERPDNNIQIPPSKNLSVNHGIIHTATIIEQGSTPEKFIIKTNNVTPMPDYDKMTTPLINKELQKVGVKPLKRARGSQLLKYIYESTHPLIGPKEKVVPYNSESDEDKRIIKRRRKVNSSDDLNLECNSKSVTKTIVPSDSICTPTIEILGDRIIGKEKLDDLIFERKQLAKIASCKVPLQIVWHNLVSSDQAIKENILLYEPLQLESLHVKLKEQGFKFHIQDLLNFLDKKCITIRTAQKQGKRHK